MSTANRPVILRLWRLHYPVTAIVSILHRITGVFLFLGLPYLLFLLGASRKSPASFAHLHTNLQTPLYRIPLALVIIAALYHVLAGLRHLVMDLGIGAGLSSARKSAGLLLLTLLLVTPPLLMVLLP